MASLQIPHVLSPSPRSEPHCGLGERALASGQRCPALPTAAQELVPVLYREDGELPLLPPPFASHCLPGGPGGEGWHGGPGLSEKVQRRSGCSSGPSPPPSPCAPNTSHAHTPQHHSVCVRPQDTPPPHAPSTHSLPSTGPAVPSVPMRAVPPSVWPHFLRMHAFGSLRVGRSGNSAKRVPCLGSSLAALA